MKSSFIGLRFVVNSHGGYHYDLYEGYFEEFIKRFANVFDAMQYANKLHFKILYYQEKGRA